jgi:subtilisin-like proprotein convertase family protein
VAIYNNSWGPSDEAGVRYADSSRVLKDALAMNVREGRGGRGNIYVWAAGNGGLNGDNSNYDGYNASPFTISVGAVGHDDIKTGYSEPGANLLVVAPSGGRGAGILTTDNTGSSGYAFGDYYDNFSGTSAATPIVSGVVALLLERRPDLGWRDVQQILALSASPVDFDPALWSRNGAGHWYSHDYGFGRVDAAAALQLAENWLLLGPEQTLELTDGLIGTPIRLPDNQTVRRTLTATEAIEVQHAEITVRLNHDDWGELRIELVSPSGTRSTLSEPHNNANSSGEPGLWTYLSTHFLGESSLGEWTLEVTDEAGGSNGSLRSWRLLLRGSHADSPANQPPLAEDLFIETTRFPVEVDTFDGVSDPEGGPVRLVSFQRPRHGTLTDLGDGRFRFSMGETKDGTDMFSVLLADDRGRVTRRMVQVLDPRPVGRNDLFPVSAGDELALPVLRNDLDPDGDPLRLTGLQANIAGTAEMQADGTIRYRSPQGFSGVERIEYSLTDDSDGDSTGWATVIVQEDPEVALEFDGEDDYLILEPAPDLNTADRFTAEAWIYPEDWGEYVTGFGRIFDRDTFIFFLNGFDHSLYADQSLVVYLILDDGSAVAANTVGGVIELDRWQHVAVSYDSTAPGSTVAIYVDGERVDHTYPLDNTSTPRRPLFNNAGRPLFMGEAPSGARAFKGRMTDFRIWDRVLDAQTVRARHDVRLEGSEPGLSLYIPLDRRLDPVAESAGSLPLTADIFEARRIPLELPWEDLESRYVMVEDSGSGWWRERHLGWIHGDRFPWVFLPGMDWIFTGQGAGESRYRFYRPLSGWGWLQSQPDLFPWIFHHQTGKWLWYLEGTDSPGWFQTESGQWFSGDSAVPGN